MIMAAFEREAKCGCFASTCVKFNRKRIGKRQRSESRKTRRKSAVKTMSSVGGRPRSEQKAVNKHESRKCWKKS